LFPAMAGLRLDRTTSLSYGVFSDIYGCIARMFWPFRKLLGSRTVSTVAPAIPSGERAYAIGDIHGCDQLFAALQQAIEAHEARWPSARTSIILLGDLIDRGPDSAAVLARAKDWQERHRAKGLPFHILMGNHEDMLLQSMAKVEALRPFVEHGGKETILSLGVSPAAYEAASWNELQNLLRHTLGEERAAFIRSFQPMVKLGDYAFTHAGIRPGVALEEQSAQDMRWIREPFLSSNDDHGAFIIHGHTIVEAPDLRSNRIGIDTGAYASGRLTALMLEGTQRWFLSAVQSGATITTSLQQAA
jgi:serine/threonine protein phosphatase 1